jgi:cyclohexanecarboxylate-CoA ligase
VVELLEAPTLWSLAQARIAASPDAEMLVDERGTLTFAEFGRAVERAAAGLHALGAGRGTTVAWQFPTWKETVVLMAALSRLGARQVPLLPIYKERELRFCLEQSGATLLLNPGEWRGVDYAGTVSASGALDDGAIRLHVCEHHSLPDGDPGALPAPPAPEEGRELRWIFYTSGSTADPKGVQHCDRSVMSSGFAMGDRQHFRPGDRYGLAFPFTHIGGATNLMASLAIGHTMVLVEAFEPAGTTRFFSSQHITATGGGTAFYMAYLEQQRQHPEAPIFPDLRFMVGGAAPMRPYLHREVRDVIGGMGVAHGYGMTEACIIATNDTEERDDDRLEHTVGRPVGRISVQIRDEAGRDLPAGAEGQITIKGQSLFAGYVDSTLDQEVFDADGWFATGDRGLLDADGYLRIVGRIKDIIIRKGENVSAEEVEGVLAESPLIADVAVIGVPDDERGEMVCAVVVPAPGVEPTLGDLVRHCIDAGMMRQKIPERLELVDTLPRLAAGKLDKRAIRGRIPSS